MNRTLLALSLLALGGCVIESSGSTGGGGGGQTSGSGTSGQTSGGTGGGSTSGGTSGGPSTGSVSFLWTFGGQSCAQAGVAQVIVQLGKSSVTVACDSSGTDGSSIAGLAPGSIDYSLTGEDAAGNALYGASSTVAVVAGADAQVQVDLQPLSPPPPPTGSIVFVWSFAQQSCEVAGVPYVAVQIGSSAPELVTCRDANGVAGITVANLPAGVTTFTLTGEDGSGKALYTVTSQVTVVAGAPTDVNANLAPTAAISQSNITLLWSFAGQGCTASGVANVSITIATTPGSNQTQTNSVPCDFQGTDGATIQNFAAGSYPFTVQGLDAAGNATYQGSGTAYVDGQTSVTISMDLAPVQTAATTGALTIDWTFGQATCAAAGVDHVHVALFDNSGAVVPGTDQTVLCSDFPNGVGYDQLAPGTYWVDLQGIVSGAVAYQTVNYEVVVFAGSTATDAIDVQPKP